VIPQRTTPVSRLFGFDRGTPIDRYYIDQFLGQQREKIRGHVLEVGATTYCERFGHDVTAASVLGPAPAEGVDVVCDLSRPGTLPAAAFDTIILTQVLNVIFNLNACLSNCLTALRPGGTLLITVPGICQISRYDMDRWGDYWRFTDRCLRMLLALNAGVDELVVSSWGNLATAQAFLDGYAHEELPREILDHHDPDYQVLVAAAATVV